MSAGALARDQLSGLHFGLGLWKGNDELMQAIRERDQANHPDDALMLIVEAVWERGCGKCCRRYIEEKRLAARSRPSPLPENSFRDAAPPWKVTGAPGKRVARDAMVKHCTRSLP